MFSQQTGKSQSEFLQNTPTECLGFIHTQGLLRMWILEHLGQLQLLLMAKLQVGLISLLAYLLTPLHCINRYILVRELIKLMYPCRSFNSLIMRMCF